MIDCLGGQLLNPQTNQPVPCEPYFGATTLIGQVIADGPAVQILDLRALRPQLSKLKQADETSRKTILAFDWYVAIRDGAAATPVGQRSPPK